MEFINTIQFVFDGKIKEISFEDSRLKPSTTVLNYLRSLDGSKAVKEGCAEGDCGACTVVIAEMAENELKYYAVDSCLMFLPALHGKQLITVEQLKDDNKIHPVQECLLNHSGTQCGYCTPGMVMSMFSLYKNKNQADKKEIVDNLSGNLCRCTGYQSIYNACEDVLNLPDEDIFSKGKAETMALLDSIANETILLKSNNQTYFRPARLKDALVLRRTHPEATIINGSTDIALSQNKKNEYPKEILDLSAVPEIRECLELEREFLVGAGLKLEQLRPYISQQIPAFEELFFHFGSKQIRNQASMGGNIGTASPIGDSIPLLMAAEASVVLQNDSQKREMKLAEFIKGYRKTALSMDEIITHIRIPIPSNEKLLRFYKVSKRKHLDISTVSMGVSLQVENNLVTKLIIAFGGMAASCLRAVKTENFLIGKAWNNSNIEKASEILKKEFTPISDARSEAESRKVFASNLLLKFYLESQNQAS